MYRVAVITALCALTLLRAWFKWKAGFYSAGKGPRLMFSRDEGIGLFIARTAAALMLFVSYIDYIVLDLRGGSILPFAYLSIPPLLRLSGVFFSLAALALLWYAHRSLGDVFTTTLRIPARRRLVVDGVYAYVRNPIYTAYCGFFTGISLLSASWLSAACSAVVMYVLMGPRLRREEALLESIFGDEYRSWAARTGRFLPKPRRTQPLQPNRPEM